MSAGFELAAEQRRVVQRLLTGGHGVDAIIGVAGSGKTILLMADHTTGLAWYLHAVQLRVTIQGPGHPDVEAATRRAYSLWGAWPRRQTGSGWAPIC